MSLDLGDIVGTVVGLETVKTVKKNVDTGEPLLDLGVSLAAGYIVGDMVDGVLDGLFGSDD